MDDEKPQMLKDFSGVNVVTEILCKEYGRNEIYDNESSWCDLLFEDVSLEEKERFLTVCDGLSFCSLDLEKEDIENKIGISVGFSSDVISASGVGGFRCATIDEYKDLDCNILEQLSLDEFIRCLKEIDTSLRLFE